MGNLWKRTLCFLGLKELSPLYIFYLGRYAKKCIDSWFIFSKKVWELYIFAQIVGMCIAPQKEKYWQTIGLGIQMPAGVSLLW